MMTMKVNGMMCGHCEAHVKTALEAIAGVKSAAADHEKGIVTIETEGEVDKEVMTKAVTAAGYEVTGFEA